MPLSMIFHVEALQQSSPPLFHVVHVSRRVDMTYEGPEEKLSKTLESIVLKWKDERVHPTLKKWRGELFGIYGGNGVLLFKLERAACGLFGVPQYGCHLNAFVKQDSVKMWVAKRAKTKQTYPGMLDNIAAGK
jgi:hypothetical protein